MRAARVVIGVAAVVITGLLVVLVQSRAGDHIATAGFWFDDVTFAVPALDARGQPLTGDERAQIERSAHDACAAAFAELRLDVTPARTAHYRVRVVQQFAPRKWGFAAAESRAFGAFGGDGAIDFQQMADAAVSLAPPGTSRAELVEAIGRGIGRVAAHELAHQILPRRDLHQSRDRSSYDAGNVYDPAQFYGPMHWDLAGSWLRDALGSRSRRPTAR
jgi:hypothetical protein